MQKYSAAKAIRDGRRSSPHGRTIVLSGKSCASTRKVTKPPRFSRKRHGHTPAAASPGWIPSLSKALTRCGWAQDVPASVENSPPGPLWCWLRPGRRVRGRCGRV